MADQVSPAVVTLLAIFGGIGLVSMVQMFRVSLKHNPRAWWWMCSYACAGIATIIVLGLNTQ